MNYDDAKYFVLGVLTGVIIMGIAALCSGCTTVAHVFWPDSQVVEATPVYPNGMRADIDPRYHCCGWNADGSCNWITLLPCPQPTERP